MKLYLDTSTDTCILRLDDLEYSRVGRYDLAEKIHTQATELKEKNGGNGDILIDKDEEKAFNDRIKQELNDAADLAKAVGGATFGEGSLEGVDTPDEDN